MSVKVLETKLNTVEKDTDRLAEDMKEVKDKVNGIDRRVVAIEEQQKTQTKSLESIEKNVGWIVKSILGSAIGAIIVTAVKYGFTP